ncbi:MAG: hypothetical protein HY000_42410 [Planctomycetes bacterium]|nr:hypothetical protein [Planctomycetota bacterium]
MSQRRSFIQKVIYLCLILALFLPLVYLNRETSGGKGMLRSLPQMRQDMGLAQSTLGEIDPASETLKLAALGMRGIAATVLNLKGIDYQKKQDWTNLSATCEQLTKLVPNFISFWKYQAWNLSYNVSVEFDDYRDRYYWVKRGIHFLRDGLVYNSREPRLLWEVGWFTSEKLGKSDEKEQFRVLFVQDDDYHDQLPKNLRDPFGRRDNWLVGKQAYVEGVQMVDRGVTLKGMSPIMFFSKPGICQIYYGTALGDDGKFGEDYHEAWSEALREWKRFGSREMPATTANDQVLMIRMNDLEQWADRAKKAAAELDAIEPGLREKLRQEKIAALPTKEREALNTPEVTRTPEQQTAAYEADYKVRVSHSDVAARVSTDKKSQAEKLANEANYGDAMADMIDKYRGIMNFGDWELRCMAEQTEEAREARKLIYDAQHRLEADSPDLVGAEQLYAQGLQKWRGVLDKFPALIKDSLTGPELGEMVTGYEKILELLDEKLPEDFILKDVRYHNPRLPE